MDAIEALYSEYLELHSYLRDAEEFTFVAELERTYPRVVVIAGASYCEVELTRILLAYLVGLRSKSPLLGPFLENQAFDRRFHTMFSWNANNVNTFWSLFGADFKDYAVARVKTSTALADAASAFLELGRLRNQLAHGDFISVPFEKTVPEVVTIARGADEFLNLLPGVFAEFVLPPEN